jgi:hypothetical protein
MEGKMGLLRKLVVQAHTMSQSLEWPSQLLFRPLQTQYSGRNAGKMRTGDLRLGMIQTRLTIAGADS